MAYSLDDGWDSCSPVARAGNACFGLYVRCGIWVARNLADGFIPSEIAAVYGSPEQTRKLVDVGLWEAVDGGYLAVDYLTLNPSAEKVRARRKAEAERQARFRSRRGGHRKTGDKTRDSAVSNGVTNGVSTDIPAAPPKGGAGARSPAPLGSEASPPPTNGHITTCPYQDRDPATCHVCRSERLGAA
jgi:hypothetical protein